MKDIPTVGVEWVCQLTGHYSCLEGVGQICRPGGEALLHPSFFAALTTTLC